MEIFVLKVGFYLILFGIFFVSRGSPASGVSCDLRWHRWPEGAGGGGAPGGPLQAANQPASLHVVYINTGLLPRDPGLDPPSWIGVVPPRPTVCQETVSPSPSPPHPESLLSTKARAHAVVPTITCTSSNVVKLILQVPLPRIDCVTV